MRRITGLVVLISFAALLLILPLGRSHSAVSIANAAQATPSSSATPVLNVINEEDVPEGSPIYQLWTTEVTLDPGVSSGTNEHDSSVLVVGSGSICYTLIASVPDGEAVVTVERPADTADVDGCVTTSPSACIGKICSLTGVNQSIYLPQGSTVTQSGTVFREYRNVGTDTAVVYFTEIDVVVDGLPCGGGCP